MQNRPKNDRSKFFLNYDEFKKMCLINSEVKKANISIEKSEIDKVYIIVTDIIKKYFPNIKYQRLLVDKSIKNSENIYPTYVYKIDKDRPEFYLIFSPGEYVLVDQGRCEMYDDKSPFEKPIWIY